MKRLLITSPEMDGIAPVMRNLTIFCLLFVIGVVAATAHNACCLPAGEKAGLQLSAIYTDHMVIQRHKPFVVRGTADAGTKITARLGTERRRTTTAEDGTWQLAFKSREATRTPLTLTVTDGDTTLTLRYFSGRGMALLGAVQYGIHVAPVDRGSGAYSCGTRQGNTYL